MSIRTTSGRSSRAASTAWSAVLRLADDLDLRLRLEDHLEAGAHERLVVDDQHPDAHVAPPATGSRAEILKPPPGRGPDSQLAAAERDALAHADEPVAAAVARVVAVAVVGHFDLDILSGVPDGDPRVRRAGVLERVRQRLLDDPVRREVDARRELDGRPLDRQLDRQARLAHLLDEFGQRADPRLRRECGRLRPPCA